MDNSKLNSSLEECLRDLEGPPKTPEEEGALVPSAVTSMPNFLWNSRKISFETFLTEWRDSSRALPTPYKRMWRWLQSWIKLSSYYQHKSK